mmetsp:Transcript_1773/g.5006  ORF Transcript_1773/g.5006 Transcript_1773/m.5006 type:complete len:218 (-) Transcript_1773:80-733(-)
MRQPLDPRLARATSNAAGDDAFFLRARLACLTLATSCFAAAAGLEGQKLGNPLLAAFPGVTAAAVVGWRGKPSVAWTEPLAIGDGVEVKASSGKGEGLFATRTLPKGTFVMDYLGEVMSDDEVNERYPNLLDARYLLELRGVWGLEPTYVDAVAKDKSNLGRYINHAGRASNLRKARQRWPSRVLRFYARRDILVGEELSFDYGDDYWIGREAERLD